MRHENLAENEKPTIPEAVFVATIRAAEAESMGCLLEDGTLLTTFHSIYDIESNTGYFDLKKMRAYFVKGNELYSYGIKSIIHDGSAVLKRFEISAITFDYARLELDEDPRKDLGGGLKLDTPDYIAMPYVSDPQETLAMSGPIFRQGADGRWHSSRHDSIAENESAKSGYYTFSQMAAHSARPGMSGQAIFPKITTGRRPLYAVHLGYDSHAGVRTGFKVSEYLATLPNLDQYAGRSCAPILFSTPGFYSEKNPNSQRRACIAEKGKAINGAIARTAVRMEKHNDNVYKTVDTRTLAQRFPQLGQGIFSAKAPEHTSTNKTVFKNPNTGWDVCYDKSGQYNTVHNEKGEYVALDGKTSATGKDEKFHFNNVPPAKKKAGKGL